MEKQSIQTRCFILQSKGTSLTRSALGPRGREGNLITVPTSSVLLHDEEACFFDVGGRERRMRMLSFLPFSAEGRRFPVIRRQCKHSLSPPPPDGSRIQFLMMIVARGGFGSTLSAAHNGPIVRRLSSRISSLRAKDTADADNPDSLVTLHRRSPPPRSGVNGEPTASIEGSAWIVTRRLLVRSFAAVLDLPISVPFLDTKTYVYPIPGLVNYLPGL